VIEKRWSPLLRVMTRFTPQRLRSKLIRVRILMTAVAVHHSLIEPYMQHGSFHVRWTMALDAVHRTVCSHQCKPSGVVIEPAQVVPVAGGVARLAPGRSAAGAHRHTFRELAAMHIIMAFRARRRSKMKPRRR
jgi:hypothetical protein